MTERVTQEPPSPIHKAVPHRGCRPPVEKTTAFTPLQWAPHSETWQGASSLAQHTPWWSRRPPFSLDFKAERQGRV